MPESKGQNNFEEYNDIDNSQKYRVKRKSNKTFTLFITVFLLTTLFACYLIKKYTPNVDLEIGSENQTSQDDNEQILKNVDERLKWIQFEDNMPGVSIKLTDENKEELLRLAEEGKTVKIDENEDNNDISKNNEKDIENNIEKHETKNEKTETNSEKVKTKPPIPTIKDINKQMHTTTSTVPTKVYLGYFSSIEMAVAAQNKLNSIDSSINPFVKEKNGYYVVQVGSYLDSTKAQNMAAKMKELGFPVKTVSAE